MNDPHSEELSARKAAARKRALLDKQQRLAAALQEIAELKRIRLNTAKRKKTRTKQKNEGQYYRPQARIMIGAKGAFGPAYNVQISTDAKAKIIVGVGLSQCSSN